MAVVRVATEGVAAAGEAKVSANHCERVPVAEYSLLAVLEGVEVAWVVEALETSRLVARAAKLAEKPPRRSLVVLVGPVVVVVEMASKCHQAALAGMEAAVTAVDMPIHRPC